MSPTVSYVNDMLVSRVGGPNGTADMFVMSRFPAVLLRNVSAFVNATQGRGITAVLTIRSFGRTIESCKRGDTGVLGTSYKARTCNVAKGRGATGSVRGLLNRGGRTRRSCSRRADKDNDMARDLRGRGILGTESVTKRTTKRFVNGVTKNGPPFFGIRVSVYHFRRGRVPHFSLPIELNGNGRRVRLRVLRRVVRRGCVGVVRSIGTVLGGVRSGLGRGSTIPTTKARGARRGVVQWRSAGRSCRRGGPFVVDNDLLVNNFVRREKGPAKGERDQCMSRRHDHGQRLARERYACVWS